MNELKPCPFCGGEAELTGFDAPEFWVRCQNCKASTDAHTCKGGAIAAWNTRAERTCRNVDEEYPYFECSECGCHSVVGYGGSGSGLPSYCPNCGRKVVDE